MSKWTVQKLVATALLVAIGIIIPIISPLKIVIDPMSFTLASHVAIMVAMLIAPDVAVVVVLGTTLGFFIGGFPPVIVARAASHIVFALLGALYLKRYPETMYSPLRFHTFSVLVAIVHASCEVVVVYANYYFFAGMPAFNEWGGVSVLFLLVGLGGIVHSIIDFEIAYGLFQIFKRQSMSQIFTSTSPAALEARAARKRNNAKSV